MAGYDCEMCGGQEPGAILITPLNGADTLAIGQDCMPVALAGLLASYTGVDPTKLYASVERLQKSAQSGQDGQDGGGEDQAAKPRRQPGASGHRPARQSRQAARTAAAAAASGDSGAAAPAGGDGQ